MENIHINPAFDQAITTMEKMLHKMEDAVSEQLMAVRVAFSEMDIGRAKSVRLKDKELNMLAKEVEEQAISVLAKHQPVAGDLRRTIGALKMSIEYERAGDYIKHLAKSIARMAAHEEDLQVFPSLMKMLGEVEKMFQQFLTARRGEDIENAVRVWLKDQRIDDLCSEAVREAFENQKRGDGSVYGLVHAVSVAKNLERIGDKIKNQVEIFYRQINGEDLDVKVD